MTRSDIHRPTEIQPEHYSYVGSFDLGAPTELEGAPSQEVYNLLHDDRRAYPGYADKCDHCGQLLRYIVLWEHEDNYHIVTGQVCAEETMNVPSRMALDQKRLREAAATRRENERKRAEAAAALVETRKLYPEAVEMLLNYDGDNWFIQDVAARLKQWGNLSPAQAEKTLEAYERENQPVVEEVKNPVPTGKVRVEGTVLKAYFKEDFYRGSRHVMLVQGDGWKVWGSVPSAIADDVDSGDKIAFNANITASDEDESFGFFKRPSKATIVEVAE